MKRSQKMKAQSGRVLILVMIFMFTLSAFWIIALSMTGSEMSFVGGRKTASQQFYDAETGVSRIFDTLSTHIPTGPLATAFKNEKVQKADGTDMIVTVRPIQDIDKDEAIKNGLPVQAHEFAPPEGSGTGVNTAVARRYAITGCSEDLDSCSAVHTANEGKVLQVGVYRVVPK